MRGLAAPLKLALARARRRPGRWLLTVAGIALATAFAGAVAIEATVAADQTARTQLSALPASARAVRVTWPGVVTPAVGRQARSLLRGLGLGPVTEVVLLGPVRLSGVLVRPAAISPLGRWADRSGTADCSASVCPMLLAGGSVGTRSVLAAPGVRIPLAGHVTLRSDVPLGFSPGAVGPQTPVVVSGDPRGLEAQPALSDHYRTHSWLGLKPLAGLHSWNLAAVERRLQTAEATLQTAGSQFSLAAPFAALDSARAQADAAPRRLLLTGGGALAALALFVVLAAAGLRRDQRQELERLQAAGARSGQCLTFAAGEAALVAGAGLVLGAFGALAAGTVLASAAGSPVGPVLSHSVVTPTGAVALFGGWLATTALITTLMLARQRWLVDALAIAAVTALALSLGRTASGDDPLPVLLAPLCCLAAGVIVFRFASALLRGGERLARRGPVLTRVALVGLARSPASPSLAIAFVAVSTGLGGFALAYRATLLRGAADEAAARVPLDALIAPGADFTRPLQLASAARWRALSGGRVLAVQRTYATYPSGAATATVPALGVPAGGLVALRGWRSGDISAPVASLAGRLRRTGAVRNPGPQLPPGAILRVHAASPRLHVQVAAALRDPAGDVRTLALGDAGGSRASLRAQIPPGRWELQGFTLNEDSSLEATNGHQNAENPAAATQFTAPLTLGPVEALSQSGRVLGAYSLAGWRGVGAAGSSTAARDGESFSFTTSGAPGVVRPAQPSDTEPVPVITDPVTARSAAPGGRLPLTVNGEPVNARLVGTLARFPTVTGTGFVVADQATLASALDAQLPGQGRTDELWVSSPRVGALRVSLARAPFSQLAVSYRAAIEHTLRTAPVARGVLGTLVAAAALALALAVLGLLVALLGQGRDERVERDLVTQGVGPRGLRRELRTRMLLAAACGVGLGVALAALLTRLAVATVRAAGLVADPRPPLVTVAPWGELLLWGVLALGLLAFAAWAATRVALTGRRTG